MHSLVKYFIVSILSGCSIYSHAQQVAYKTADKKIIDLYSNPPTVVEAFDMISKKPKNAIDGYIIKLPKTVGEGYIFDVKQWKDRKSVV